MSSDALNPVWAVVSSYRPGSGLADVVSSVMAQVTGVVVVDDGSGPVANMALDNAETLGAVVLRLSKNSGIAAALNHGIEHAMASGARAFVTLDQDSELPSGFVDALLALHASISRSGLRPGPVVPEIFAGVRQAGPDPSSGLLVARNAIQSGMLISRDVIDAVGRFREDFFIDLVDTEFELRCAAAGYVTYAAPGLSLGHQLGTRYSVGGPLGVALRSRAVTLSSPLRYYYRARNRVRLEKMYGSRYIWRLTRDGVVERVHFLLAFLIAKPHRPMWGVLRAGLRSGRRNGAGRAPDEVEMLAARVTWNAREI